MTGKHWKKEVTMSIPEPQAGNPFPNGPDLPAVPTDDESYWTLKFWKRTADRALKTFFQLLSVALAAPAFMEQVLGSNLVSIPWQSAITGALMGTLISVLMSLGGKKLGGNTADPAWFNTK